MNTILRYCLGIWAATIVAGHAFAADPDLTGTWQGKLQAAPNAAITIQFIFARKPDGTYTATVNSPDSGAIKNVAAGSVAVNAGTVKLQVPSLSGSYAGTVKGGNIEGEWTQPGGVLPLILSPYQKPEMTKSDVDTLVGTWNGPMQTPLGAITFVTQFKLNDKGGLEGTLSIPEQGAQAPISDIEFAGSKLTFKVPMGHAVYSATYANATLTGTWSQGGPPQPLNLKRGEFAVPVVPLKITSESFARLRGNWEGTLHVSTPQGQKVALPIVIRFESDAKARMVGFLDSPSQSKKGIPISDASLTGSKLVVRVSTVNVEYDADLADKSLTGSWKQGPVELPLTLTRK